MAAARYRQFLRLTEQWPLDPTKSKKRDLGQLLRERISEGFSQGESTEIKDPKKCDNMLGSLQNISENRYKKQYPWTRETGCCGVTYENIHFAVSEEGLKTLNEESAGIVRRTLLKLKRPFRRNKGNS